MLLTNWHESEVPTIPSSGSINLLELPTELRKTVYLLDYQFIIKDITQEQPDGRDAEGKVWRRGTGSSPKPVLLGSLWKLHYKGITDQITDHW